MKKLLSILGLFGLLTPATVTLVGCGSNSVAPKEENPSEEPKKPDLDEDSNEINNLPITIHQLSGFTNLIKIINSKYGNSENLNTKKVDTFLSTIFPEFYYEAINNTKGILSDWTRTPRKEKRFTHVYEGDFINETYEPIERIIKGLTTKTVEYQPFTVSLPEKILTNSEITINSLIELPRFGDRKFSFSFKENSESAIWSTIGEILVKEEFPDQTIIQEGRTKLHVDYKIYKITVDNKGLVRFRINNIFNKSFKVPIFVFNDQGNFDYFDWKTYSPIELIQELKSLNYGNQLKMTNENQFSILSVDDINNPKNIYVNLPIHWTSEDGGMDFAHSVEKIK